jgi:hypothetical protein
MKNNCTSSNNKPNYTEMHAKHIETIAACGNSRAPLF